MLLSTVNFLYSLRLSPQPCGVYTTVYTLPTKIEGYNFLKFIQYLTTVFYNYVITNNKYKKIKLHIILYVKCLWHALITGKISFLEVWINISLYDINYDAYCPESHNKNKLLKKTPITLNNINWNESSSFMNLYIHRDPNSEVQKHEH